MAEKILIIDDEIDICQLLTNFLKKKGYEAEFTGSAKKGLEKVKSNDYDLVLLDFRLPDMDGKEALQALKKLDHNLSVIIITGYSDVKTAVDCIKLGASEYVTKPIHPEEILLSVKNSLKEDNSTAKASSDSDSKPKRKTSNSGPKEFIQGESSQAKKLDQLINLLAPTSMRVVIEGESGTGKEMVANAIHQKSKRADKPFIAIDCGALPKELAASELFGHIKGSFTGAINNKTGHFEAANGGTLFMDEIGNLTYDNQVKLLRVLQERKIKKIGDTKSIDIDVRLIAASNESLEEKVKAGEFREDLYYRINEFLVEIPPLRERNEDTLIFAKHFLQEANQDLERDFEGFDTEVELTFKHYNWPGNLRELKNVIKRAVLLGDGKNITKAALPREITTPSIASDSNDIENEPITDLKSVAERAERRAILKVLEQTDYNKTKTAQILKIDRKTLYNKMDSYEIKFKKTYE